jgi:UDP-2,3-diacylglucosamine pyrophosphatase LpxH
MSRARRNDLRSRSDDARPAHAPPDVERPPDVPPPDPRAIADVADIPVPRGHRIVCVSDLHLRPARTDASGWAVPHLIRALDALEGPATLVLLGDVLEMWFVQPPDGSGSLEAHDDLVAAVRRFQARPSRSVVYVIGNHDARLAWDGGLLETVRDRLGCVFALSAELVPDGDGGRVRVEHGHAHDPANAFRDPRDPRESPLGMHLVEEVLPELAFAQRGVLDGVEGLANPRTFPGFLSSRYFYRRLLGVAGWIVVPLALLYLGRLAASMALVLSGNERLGLDAALGARFIGLDAAQLGVLLAVSFLAIQAARRQWREGASAVASRRGATQNANTRDAARDLVARGGYAGMVAAHTHHSELSEMPGGFYANTGSCTRVIDRVHARLRLPAVYLPRLQLSWIVLEWQDDWSVRLFAARRTSEGASRLERLAAAPDARRLAADPVEVARWPDGPLLPE